MPHDNVTPYHNAVGLVLKSKQVTSWHISQFNFILKRMKLADAFKRKLCDRTVLSTFWKRQILTEIADANRKNLCHETTISNHSICNSLIEKYSVNASEISSFLSEEKHFLETPFKDSFKIYPEKRLKFSINVCL